MPPPMAMATRRRNAPINRRSDARRGSSRTRLPSIWSAGVAAALILAAPLVCLQAAANAGMPVPQWVRAWNGFRLADDARERLSGDARNPQAGVAAGPGALELARAAYAREPLASNALFVLALAQVPLTEDYRAGPIAREGVLLDKRSALLQLLMITDAATRRDYPELFAHADLLAAAHPDLAEAVLAPLFARLGDPAVVPIVAAALADDPRWAPAFKRHVPDTDAALTNYAALRRQTGVGERWESDEKLVAAFADKGRYDEAFGLWRSLEGANADAYGFFADARFAPIGWRLTERGERSARILADGTMTVRVERGAGGELARRLLQLPPGRYRLEVGIAANERDPLLVTLHCARRASNAARRPLTARTEFTVGDVRCPAYWLILDGSALDRRHGIDATLSGWRFTRIS